MKMRDSLSRSTETDHRTAQDTGRVVIRIISAVLIVLVSLLNAVTSGSTFVIAADLLVIVLAVGFALGKQLAGDILIVLLFLSALGYGYLWLGQGERGASVNTIIWALLFLGVWYGKPTTVRRA